MKLKEFYDDYINSLPYQEDIKSLLNSILTTVYDEKYKFMKFLFIDLSTSQLSKVEYRMFKLLYKDRVVCEEMIEKIPYYPDYFNATQTMESVFITNADKYEHLYGITIAEYNPIDNYNRKEFTETTYSDEHTTYIKGTDTTTDVYGNTTDTEVNGERDNSTTFGASSIDSVRDTTTGRSVDNIRAFDSDVSIEIANNTYTMSGTDDGGKLKDTTTQAEHTDTEHADEYTNTKTSAEHTDTHTNSGHTDEQTSDTHSTTVESVVAGNVGVTQTVTMLESERDFWKLFSFLEIVYEDIINEICEIVY